MLVENLFFAKRQVNTNNFGDIMFSRPTSLCSISRKIRLFSKNNQEEVE